MGRVTPEDIPPGSTVGIDTVAWIYLLERHPVHYPTARRFFARLEAGELQGVAASLVLTELLVPAYRAGEPRRARELARILENFPHLRILDLTPPVALRAADLRARYGLRTPDAIHCATAMAARCDAVLTNDAAFLRISSELTVYLFEAPSQDP